VSLIFGIKQIYMSMKCDFLNRKLQWQILGGEGGEDGCIWAKSSSNSSVIYIYVRNNIEPI